MKVNCEVLSEVKDAPAQRKVTRYNFTKADYDKKEANFLLLPENFEHKPAQSAVSMWDRLFICLKTSLEFDVPTYTRSPHDKP